MNLKNSVLNSTLLGSAGSAVRSYIKATQECVAQVTASFRAARRLFVSANPHASGTATLRAGRRLSAQVTPQCVATGRLFGWVAVPVTISQSMEAKTASVLSLRRPVGLSAAATCSAVVTNQLRISRCGHLQAAQAMVAEWTPFMLYRCKSLVASLQALAVFDVQMLEANRAKAPKERIAYIPGTSRTAIVQGAK